MVYVSSRMFYVVLLLHTSSVLMQTFFVVFKGWFLRGVRPCVYQGGQKDMSQPVDIEIIEIVFGKIQPESPSEVFDSFLKFVFA